MNDFTGWFTIFVAFLTGTIPALMLLTGNYVSTAREAVWLVVISTLAIGASYALSKRIPTPASLTN